MRCMSSNAGRGRTPIISTSTRLIEDPKFYTQPFHYSRTWIVGGPDDQLREFACSEDNVDAKHIGFGPGPIRKDGTRGYDDPAPLPPPVTRSAAPAK